MKEQILDLIKQHFTAILVKSVRAEDLVSEQSLLNLATSLDKAIGIDRKQLLFTIEHEVLPDILESGEIESETMAEYIINSRPLKFEVKSE